MIDDQAERENEFDGEEPPLSEEDLIAATPDPAARVSQEMLEQSSRILANWSLRVTTIPEFRASPDIHLAQLQEGVPELLEAVLSAMAASDPALEPEIQARTVELATTHGQRRATEGFSIGVLIAELQELRAELWAAILRVTEADPALAEIPATLQDRLARTFDPLIVDAAEAWVETQAGGETTNPPA
jgi:hypothetical protein